MRDLLLLAALVMATTAAMALATSLLVATVRVRRAGRVAELVAAGRLGDRPRSGWVRREVLLEYAERLTAASLRSAVPWSTESAAHAARDLRRRSWSRRARGLRTLQPLGVTDEQVTAALRDRHASVRSLAATAATGHTETAVRRALVRLLDDRAPYVRYSALDALTRRAAANVDSLQEALAATPVLESVGLDEVDRLLASADRRAMDESWRLAGTAAPDGADTAAATSAVGSGVVSVVLRRAPRSGRLGTTPRPLRATTVRSRSTRTILLLLQAAAPSADTALVPAVFRFRADARPEVRAAAVRTLAALGVEPEQLLCQLDDPDGRVRTAAAAAMGQLGAREMSSRLVVALSDRDHGVRQSAAHALGCLGPPGRLLLEDTARGDDEYAADAARAVLRIAHEPT